MIRKATRHKKELNLVYKNTLLSILWLEIETYNISYRRVYTHGG